jgi:DNA (cytosine-5)-methyltransferase 1
MATYTSLEICAGAGGQAVGLEQSGFRHRAAIEIEKDACDTLSKNLDSQKVLCEDLKVFDAKEFNGVDLLAGGVPCPPFSMASKQLGREDERDLFPDALRIARQTTPKAILLENVRGLSSPKFKEYREWILKYLGSLGYRCDWRLLNASDFGVPQLRPRFILVALKDEYAAYFNWPTPHERKTTVGQALVDLMAAEGWSGALNWAENANDIAPTLVGGSKKHGGADLGPTRAKQQWLKLGVDGRGIANSPPTNSDPMEHIPRLTLRMAARIQGFPDFWKFSGSKTSVYRQIGNAFPPPVASAIGTQLIKALNKEPHKNDSSLFTLA